MIRDLLNELEAYADGNLRIEFLDPTEDPELEGRVRSLGIPKAPLMVLEKDRQISVEVYLGIAILYADKKEIIPFVLDNTNLEYEVVAAILRVTRPKKTVGFLTGHGEHDIYGDYRVIAEAIRKQHDVETVTLADGKAVPDHVTTLIVAGPKQPFDDWASFQLDQFLMRGGRAMFLVDMVGVDPAALAVQPLNHGLADQLASYGVRPLQALVGDWGSQEMVQLPDTGSYGGQPMYYVVQYPLWPKVLDLYMSAEHPVVNRLPSIVLPWTSALEVAKHEVDAFEVTELLKSTELARAEEGLVNAHPQSMVEPESEDELSQFLLAAAVTGPQRSFWADRPAPEPPPTETADSETEADPAAPLEPALPERRDAVEATQILVVGGSEFAADPMLQQRPFSSNLIFVLNGVDWLTVGDELLGIRSRVTSPPYLDPAKRENGGEKIAKVVNIAVVPLLVAVFGIVWRQARRSRRVVLT